VTCRPHIDAQRAIQQREKRRFPCSLPRMRKALSKSGRVGRALIEQPKRGQHPSARMPRSITHAILGTREPVETSGGIFERIHDTGNTRPAPEDSLEAARLQTGRARHLQSRTHEESSRRQRTRNRRVGRPGQIGQPNAAQDRSQRNANQTGAAMVHVRGQATPRQRVATAPCKNPTCWLGTKDRVDRLQAGNNRHGFVG